MCTSLRRLFKTAAARFFDERRAAWPHAREVSGERRDEFVRRRVTIEVVVIDVEDRRAERPQVVEAAVELAGLDDELRTRCHQCPLPPSSGTSPPIRWAGSRPRAAQRGDGEPGGRGLAVGAGDRQRAAALR
jgi:hypothetical protein